MGYPAVTAADATHPSVPGTGAVLGVQGTQPEEPEAEFTVLAAEPWHLAAIYAAVEEGVAAVQSAARKRLHLLRVAVAVPQDPGPAEEEEEASGSDVPVVLPVRRARQLAGHMLVLPVRRKFADNFFFQRRQQHL